MTSESAAQMLRRVIHRHINDTYSKPISEVLGIPFEAVLGLSPYVLRQLEKQACDRFGISYQDYLDSMEDKS
jgi:hypothetical protein